MHLNPTFNFTQNLCKEKGDKNVKHIHVNPNIIYGLHVLSLQISSTKSSTVFPFGAALSWKCYESTSVCIMSMSQCLYLMHNNIQASPKLIFDETSKREGGPALVSVISPAGMNEINGTALIVCFKCFRFLHSLTSLPTIYTASL